MTSPEINRPKTPVQPWEYIPLDETAKAAVREGKTPTVKQALIVDDGGVQLQTSEGAFKVSAPVLEQGASYDPNIVKNITEQLNSITQSMPPVEDESVAGTRTVAPETVQQGASGSGQKVYDVSYLMQVLAMQMNQLSRDMRQEQRADVEAQVSLILDQADKLDEQAKATFVAGIIGGAASLGGGIAGGATTAFKGDAMGQAVSSMASGIGQGGSAFKQQDAAEIGADIKRDEAAAAKVGANTAIDAEYSTNARSFMTKAMDVLAQYQSSLTQLNDQIARNV